MQFKNKTIDEAFEAFEAGFAPKDLVPKGFPKASAYSWYKKWQANKPATPEVEQVKDPPPIRAANDPPAGKTVSKKGITEETAGFLLQMGFGIWARLAKNDLCYLTAAEAAQLQHPFAQTLHAIPAPFAEAINTYAPPVTFAVQLVEVIQKKQELIVEQRRRSFDPLAQRVAAQQPTVAPQQPAPPVQPEPPVASENGRSSGVIEPEPEFHFGG